MHSFRLRLILALIAGVTLLSVASTYFEVLEHKHVLRQELEWRSSWMGSSLKPQMEQALAQGNSGGLPTLVANAKAETGALGVGVYDPQGQMISSAGVPAVFQALAHAPFESLAKKTPVESLSRTQRRTIAQKGNQVNAFGHTGNIQWLQEVFPLHDGTTWSVHWSILVDADISGIRVTTFGAGVSGGSLPRWC